MKRDMELARKILFALEACDNAWGPCDDMEIAGYSQQEVAYHVKLLCQADLIEAEDVSSMGPEGFSWIPSGLTWEGHEFLEAARDDTRWNKTMKTVQEKAGGLIFDVLKETLVAGVKGAVGL